ncbi:MAG TPA: FecR family protein [Puia sp.]|nr:FecR family protein [Puia sp.]
MQYLKNTSSEQELEEFLSHVKTAKYDQALRDMIREVYNDIYEADPTLVSYIDERGSLVLKSGILSLDPPPARPAGNTKKLWSGLVLLALALLAGTVWWNNQRDVHMIKTPQLASIQSLTKKFTETSEHKFLVLSDSTQVWLNGNSSLEYPDDLSGKKREVYLAGEAWFDVKNAEEVPFIIHTGNITTTVLGTSFNIKAYPYLTTVMVSVSRGKVKVSRKDNVVAILEKGQQVKVSNVDSLVRQKNIDAGNIAFWQQGYVSYDDETIGEIVQDLEHLNNVVINVTDHSLLNTRITTSFNRSIGVDQELKLICKLIDKQLNKRNGQYTIE